MSRRGVTLVEIMVALLVACLISYVGWNAIIGLGKSEKLVDRDASRAILEAQLLEQLFLDLRSALQVNDTVPGTFTIRRAVAARAGTPMTETTVTWTFAADRVTRAAPPERPHEYNFAPYLTAAEPVLKFRMEKIRDVLVPSWLAH